MRKVMLFAGAAALAAAMPALAQNEGRGKGRGNDARAESQQRGGGNDRAERRGRGQERAERRGRGGGEDRARGNRGGERRAERSEARQQRANSGRDGRRAERRVERRAERSQRRAERGVERRVERRLDRADDRIVRREWVERRESSEPRLRDDFRRWREARRGDARDSRRCPPGLARQNRFCMPPGQLKKARLIGQRIPVADWSYNVPDRYRYRFNDGDRHYYRYGDDGTVYRFDRSSGLISRVVPLFGNDLYVGEPLPLGYEVYNVPLQYRPYYADTDDHYYRYDDSAIYRVDRESMLVEGIVALLTGGAGGLGGLGVGDALPGGYDVYNVPFDHRDTYYDSPDAMYRYADGSIYQVDPETRLIEAVISLLT